MAPLVSRMLVAADNLHAANPSVAQALKDLDPLPLQEIARRCQRAGAEFLDLNPWMRKSPLPLSCVATASLQGLQITT